jgi:hypothetical protein
VVDDGRIVELVARGAGPAARVDYVFDASRHVIPGLVNRTTDVTCSELISGTRMVNDRERRRVYRDTQRPRYCALLKLPFPVQCSRRASVERDGQFYCGLHDPRRPPRQITQRKE